METSKVSDQLVTMPCTDLLTMPEDNVALISLHPHHAEKIMSGEKRLEFRRVWAARPVGTIVIYATAPIRRVLGIARVKAVHHASPTALWKLSQKIGGGLSRRELYDYFSGRQEGYALELSEVHPFAQPLDPGKMWANFRAPQSFEYVDKTVFIRLAELARIESGQGKVLFVAGVHGVGKTTLCEQFANRDREGILQKSAGQLIQEAKATAIASHSKAVKDIAGNQELLIQAVRRIRMSGKTLILDGHFALLNSEHKVQGLPKQVFSDLRLDGIVLIQEAPAIIASRIAERDGKEMDVGIITELQKCEISTAEKVAEELLIPISTIKSTDTRGFSRVINTLLKMP